MFKHLLWFVKTVYLLFWEELRPSCLDNDGILPFYSNRLAPEFILELWFSEIKFEDLHFWFDPFIFEVTDDLPLRPPS